MTTVSAGDRLDRLYAVVDRYARRYPDQHTPSGYLTRLIEELGEIAVEVQRLEGIPGKVAKHGPGSVDELAGEVEDLLHTVLGLVRVYSAEAALDAAIDREFAKVTREQGPGH
ncbi:MAG: MazG-like family protein [Microlunatus sp.]|nr:MazG-like family protein [Microlunatus sp.]